MAEFKNPMAAEGEDPSVAEGEPPPASFEELPGPVTFRGWLEKRKPGFEGKKSKKGKGWDKRYCLLSGRMLLYYKPGVKKWNSPTGIAVLSDGATITMAESPDTLRVGYAVQEEEWTFALRAPSAAAAEAWLSAFAAQDVPLGPPEIRLPAQLPEPPAKSRTHYLHT